MMLTDAQTGLQTPIEFFVAILPCSQLTYACGSPSQKSNDFLGCIRSALDYFGGVPNAIVTDNLKPAVTRVSKYDPQINLSMSQFAEYYDLAVLPTRAYKPRDKALVESAVNILYTRVYAPLYDRVFHTLEQFKATVKDLIDRHNKMPFQQKPYSRLDQFNTVEKMELRPLPEIPFVIRNFQNARVHPNCHVYLKEDKHNYSVPFQYVSKEIQIVYDTQMVEIFKDFDRIATHQRIKQPYTYSTIEKHLHPAHRYYAIWSESFFLDKGKGIGANTLKLIEKIFHQCKHPEQGFKLCQGVLQLAKRYGQDRIEHAATICVDYEFVSYRKIEHILTIYQKCNPQDQSDTAPTIQHENIRGADHYQ